MTRFQHALSLPVSPHRRNFLAIIISFLTVSFLYFNFEPKPAGADPDAFLTDITSVTTVSPMLTAQSASKPDPDSQEADSAGATDMLAQGKAALMLNLLLLEKGYQQFSVFSDYIATFFKRERVDGVLGDGQIVNIKVRHEPFSVYMKWVVGDRGREVLYVDGKNDGKLLVKKGGFAGRILGALKLDPNGSLAMKESRHPVTKAGLLNLVGELLIHRRKEVLLDDSLFHCVMLDNQEVNNRSCYGFVLEFDNRTVSQLYRKSVMYLDKELLIPLHLQNYTWPEHEGETDAQKLDAETIIEHYTFSNIKLNLNLADLDFDRTNENYSLRR
jgi:hypothetical protein